MNDPSLATIHRELSSPNRVFIGSYSIATQNLVGLFDHIHQHREAILLSVSTIGNFWEPMRRWQKAESRILKNSPSILNRVTVNDIVSLGELYGFSLVRWQAKKITPFPTQWIPLSLRKIGRKLPVIKHLAKDIQISFYREAGQASDEHSKSVSIIIPARNEEGNEHLLREAIDLFLEQFEDVEVILVEGNSTDRTFEMLTSIQRDYVGKMNIRLLKQNGKGKKNAVICGLKESHGDVLAIIDCDFTVNISDSISAIKISRKLDCCMINCSRIIYPMEKDAMRWFNYIGNRAFALLVSALSEQPVSDALCGTKIFTRSMYKEMMSNNILNSPKDPFGDFAIIFGASNLHYRILNYPVRYYARRSGAPNISRWKDSVKLLIVCWHQLTR